MRPSRLLLPIIVLLSSSISHVNAEVIAEPSREQRIEQEVKRYAVPSLVKLLKKADAEGRVIPLESFSLTEPHRLLDAEIMSRPAGHVHPALLDERYYAVTEDRESQKDLSYMEELEDGLYYVILDSESHRPQFALCFQIWDSEWLYHYEYDDLGNLREVRSYAVELPLETSLRTYPNLREEYHYSDLNKTNINYRRFSHSGWTRGNIDYPYETEFRSHDGGRTMDLTVFPVLETGQRSGRPCLYYRTIDGWKVSGRLSGESFCVHLHGPYFRSTLVDGVDFPLETSLPEGDYLFKDFEQFFAYRYPDVRLDELTTEFLAFQDGFLTEARFWKGNRLLLEFKFLGYKGKGIDRSFSWQMTFPDSLLLAEDEQYTANIDWPDYRSEVTLIYKGHKEKRRLTAKGMLDIRREGLLREPYFEDLHPLLKMYLIERLKEKETPPAQRRTYAVMPSQAADLQRIIDSSRPGDTIRLHAGTYRLDKTLKLMDKSYLTLLADLGVEVLISDPHAPVIEMIRGNQVRLEGFRAKHEAADGCSTPVISIKDSRHIVLRHLELDGSGTHAVRMSFSRDILVEHNYLHSNSHAAFEMQSALKNVVIRFNRIENNPQVFQDSFLSGTGEIEFYGNTGQPLTRQRCKKLEEKKGDRYVRCGRYQ